MSIYQSFAKWSVPFSGLVTQQSVLDSQVETWL